jgi:hypothetical protein
MRISESIQRLTLKVVGLLASRLSEPEFVCGDCDRWQRCGLPSDNCPFRPEQIARHEQSRRMRRLNARAMEFSQSLPQEGFDGVRPKRY